jgi:hypothetical protein
MEGFTRAVRNVLSDPRGWRAIVERVVRPNLEEMMAPENWWNRFLEAVRLT